MSYTTPEKRWDPIWIRGGKIIDIIYIGQDILAWCTGVHIVFFSISLKKISLRWCWNNESGDGVCCMSSHVSLPIFCYAETKMNPRILIYSYPTMTKMSECIGGCNSGYLATAFTMRKELVSVGSYPHFPMIVWCWRTGEKLAMVNTYIRDEVGQVIRITTLGPTIVAQMGRTCGKLITWELDVAAKVVTLKDHEVWLPRREHIVWVDWSPYSNEPLLAITDDFGHIFLSNFDGSTVYRIVLSQRCGVCDDIDLPFVRWFRNGIVLRTTFCQLRFFTKNPNTNQWQKEWYLKSIMKPSHLVIHPFRTDCLFYHTWEGYLMRISFPEGSIPNVDKYLDYGTVHRFADFVYPWCHHLVVTDIYKEIIVLECYSGTLVATYDAEIESEINCQASHLDYPLIIYGTLQGELLFVSFVDPHVPTTVAYLKLQKNPLDLIKFSYSGRTLAAVEKKTGNCFCINLHRDKVYTVKALVQAYREITDVLIYEARKKLYVFMILVGAKSYFVGQQLMLFTVSEKENLVNHMTTILDMPGVYRTLWNIPTNATTVIGAPYLTRQLRIQKIKDFNDVVLVDGLISGHHVKLTNIFVNRYWITTTSFDGLVIIRDDTIHNVLVCFITHHRSESGSVKAMPCRTADLVVSLGFNGTLVAMKKHEDKKDSIEPTTTGKETTEPIYHVDYSLYERLKKKIKSDYASLDSTIQDMLTCPKLNIPDPAEGDITWMEWRDKKELKEQQIKCAAEKAAILRDFEVLKNRVKKLLDDNETCPEIERLPVSAFDLNIAGRDHKLKARRDECHNIHMEMEHNCSEMDRVSKWIRKTFWDPQVVVGKSLTAILGKMQVINYPSVAPDPLTKYHLEWAHFTKEAVQQIMDGNTFRPWQVYTDEELQVELNKREILRQEEGLRIDLLLDDEEEKEISEAELERQKGWEGSTAYQFIETSPCYPQIESYSFEHVTINNHFLMHDCEKLRAYFNQAFNEVYELKEREMHVIQERIDRIRCINTELSTMFKRHVPYIPADPKWHWQERPENIITVLDHEVDAKPYISPSQQELLDKQAAEAERNRLLLLADDFRERALMAMMNGVLEVRWEDTIKIDVPKPACMLEKKPEDYTPEDVRAVKQYKQDVRLLREERKRYNRMLDAEYTKVMGYLREGADRFNAKLDELFHLKINIESAINQMHLRYVRGCLRNYNRTKALRQEEEAKEHIEKKQRYAAILESHEQTFQKVHEEFLFQYNAFCNREKSMLKRAMNEFASLPKFQVELLERQYKRRPKTKLKNLSATDFLDLSGHVVARTWSLVYLPQESTDYLKALDHLDVRPNVLPLTIDSSHWETLTRVRRQKIEMELRIRSKEIEIMDVEKVINGIKQRRDKCNVDMIEVMKNFDEMRNRQRNYELDVDVQLVLKMGQLEINLRGDVRDTENAILISREEIDKVNNLIRAAGDCKLDALSRLLNFKSGTLMKEWRHECQKRRLEDLQEDLRSLELMKVTKEMQQYLKRKARGFPDDKTPERLQRDIESTKQWCEKVIDKHRSKLRSIEKEIEITRSKNEQLDRRIFEMNMARCEMEYRRDLIGESRQREHMEWKIRMFMKRSRLIRKLQNNYAELLMLQTEQELLRLRRYPTLHYETLDDTFDEEDHDPPPRRHFCPC